MIWEILPDSKTKLLVLVSFIFAVKMLKSNKDKNQRNGI
jgi:hypothetical protein